MAITDELRKYVKDHTNWDVALTTYPPQRTMTYHEGAMDAIADRIDAAHAHGMEERADRYSELRAKMNNCYIELPKDYDGELVDIGDLVDEMLPSGGYAKPARVDTMELYRSANGYGWMVKLDAENRALISPKLLRHHKQPTVEDVLREFALACEDAGNAGPEVARIAAEYAAKLRLVGEDE